MSHTDNIAATEDTGKVPLYVLLRNKEQPSTILDSIIDSHRAEVRELRDQVDELSKALCTLEHEHALLLACYA